MPANARSAIIIDFTTREDWFENLLPPEHDRSGLEENIPILRNCYHGRQPALSQIAWWFGSLKGQSCPLRLDYQPWVAGFEVPLNGMACSYLRIPVTSKFCRTGLIYVTDVKGIDRFLGPTEDAQCKNASCFRHRNIGQSLAYSVGEGTFPTTRLLRAKFGIAGAAEPTPSTWC